MLDCILQTSSFFKWRDMLKEGYAEHMNIFGGTVLVTELQLCPMEVRVPCCCVTTMLHHIDAYLCGQAQVCWCNACTCPQLMLIMLQGAIVQSPQLDPPKNQALGSIHCNLCLLCMQGFDKTQLKKLFESFMEGNLVLSIRFKRV